MKKRGSVTIEATIILPIYVLLLTFMINSLNMFYFKMTVQSGLNNAGTTIAQYCYAIDLLVDGGMQNFALNSGTSDKVYTLRNSAENLIETAGKTMSVFDQTISFEMLDELIENGKLFYGAAKATGNALNGISGDDVKNYFFTIGAETGGEMILKAMVERYLDDMKVNRNLLDGDIRYEMYIDVETEDMILIARYLYKNQLFSVFTPRPFCVEQQVVVHPWVGGKTKSLRSGN